MSDPTPIANVITSQADAPASETVDGQSVSERPLADLIQADQHIAGGQALGRKKLGLIFRRIRQGDALGNQNCDR